MPEEKQIIIDVELDTKDFDKEIGNVNTKLEENRKQIQDWVYLVYEALHEIVDNKNIERSELIKEFQKRITDPERVKRYRANNN